jgi:hypothetical protein
MTYYIRTKMEYRELAKLIPKSKRSAFADRLTDILLESGKGAVPPYLAKIILHYWQRDQLGSQVGLTHLIEAMAIAEPEKLALVLDEFSLKDLAKEFSPIWDKTF